MKDTWWLRALVVTAICVVGSSPAQAQFGGLSKIKKAVERAHQQTDSAMTTLDTAVSTATDMANDVSGNRDTTKAAAAKAKGDGASTGATGKGGKGTAGGAKGSATGTGSKSTSTSTSTTSSGQTSTAVAATTGGTTVGNTTTAVTRGTTTTTTTVANASTPALTDANVKKVIAGIKAQQASLKANPTEQITAAAAGVKASGFSEAGYRYMTARILMYCSEGPSVLPKTFKPDELQALDGNRSAIVPLCTDQTITVR